VGGAATVLSSAFTGCSAATGGSGGSNGGGTGSAGSAGSTGNAGAVQASGGSIHSSRLYNNTVGRMVIGSGSTVDATNNWWGTNTPDSSALVANAAMDSWLRLGVTASPSSIGTGGTSVVRANLLWNNTGYNTSVDGFVPDGIPIIFTLVSGPGSLGSLERTTSAGANTTTYSSAVTGTAAVNASVDGESVGVLITVSSAAPTTTATPVPTATVTATFTQIPGSGTGGSGHQAHSSGSSGGSSDLGYTGPQPTVMGYEPTQPLPTGISAPGPQQQAQPTALEAATPGSGTSSGFPVTILALFGAGGVVIAGSAWYIRRWWIRRQNPALFKEYD